MNDYIFYAPYVPENWKIIPNKYVFIPHSKKVGKDFRNYNLLSLTKNGVILKDIESNEGKLPASFEGYQTVERNDLILCLFDLDVSAVFSGLSEYQGMITSAYDVYQVNTQLMIPKFADYWFANVFSERSYSVYSKSLRHTIAYDSFKNIPIAVPSLGTQSKIVSFLSEKIKTIDSLISNETKQIEKLEEYKKAVITNAVTKGLDSDAKMKDSGVEWIGEIPEKWGKCRLKNVITIENGKEIMDDGGNIPVYGSGGIFKFTDRPIFVGQSLLMGRKGTIDKPMLVDGPFWTVDTMFYTSRIENINARFLYYACSGLINFDFYKSGSVLPSMTQTELYNVWITLPGPSEQQAIADYLDGKCTKIKKFIDIKKEKIGKLQDYKKSLIYEYVTGKKAVEA